MTGDSQLKEARMIKYSGEMAEKTKSSLLKRRPMLVLLLQLLRPVFLRFLSHWLRFIMIIFSQ